jgi:hypothetical protein
MDRVIVGKRLRSDFRASYPAIELSSDSLLLFSETKKSFRLFGDIENVEQVSDILTGFIEGVHDNAMPFDASALIPVDQGTPLASRPRNRLLRMQFVIPVIAGPIFLVTLFLIVRKRILKVE